MATVSERAKRALGDLLYSGPNSNGDFKGYCPLHQDTEPSASFNFRKSQWVCFADCGGGSLKELLDIMDRRDEADFVPSDSGGAKVVDINSRRSKGKKKSENVTEVSVTAWHRTLLDNEGKVNWLKQKRGLTEATIKAYRIGWDPINGAFTIPIFGRNGELHNVRRYRPARKGRRSQYWNVDGMGNRRIYPENVLDEHSTVLLVEGEFDMLLANQNGLPAVTATGGASGGGLTDALSAMFVGKSVFILYDADETGKKGAAKAAAGIAKHANRVHIVELPFEFKKNHGEDLSDYFIKYDHDADDVRELMNDSREYSVKQETGLPEEGRAVPVSVLGSFNAELSGKPLELVATITGKRNPPFQIGRRLSYRCTMDAGNKCAVCPMMTNDGEMKAEVMPNDPIVLDLLEAPKAQVQDAYRRLVGAVKCGRLTIEEQEWQNVEELFARPSVDTADDAAQEDYTNRKILSVGRYDTGVNKTFRVVGTVLPSPKTQRAEFLAWDVEPTESSIDTFEVSDHSVELLNIFQPKRGQAPLQKLGQIARDISTNVTGIVGRVELHMAMDLVYHSVLNFHFGGSAIGKGWLELLVVGDTRTGKSAAAEALSSHYGAGRLVSCESASFAGIVGGLQQFGAGREWTISWGAIPLNDRRLIVLDEVSGLTMEQIGQMSSIRSSGIAQITKIQTEQTTARTRLIWMGNPRNGRLADFTYGIHAIGPLIGNPEDVARFDLAMSVAGSDVKSSRINRATKKKIEHRYTAEACHTLIKWVWSRKTDDVVWADGAQEEVFRQAVELGNLYVDDPPLIQAANVRIKIARLAVALAARTFSTDDSHEKVVVRSIHVRDAVKFLNHIYAMDGFGYRDASEEAIEDRKASLAAMDETSIYLRENPGLAKFLRSVPGGFRRQDLEDMMNMSREEATATINRLWVTRMIRRSEGEIKIMPMLHQLLREIKE